MINVMGSSISDIFSVLYIVFGIEIGENLLRNEVNLSITMYGYRFMWIIFDIEEEEETKGTTINFIGY